MIQDHLKVIEGGVSANKNVGVRSMKHLTCFIACAGSMPGEISNDPITRNLRSISAIRQHCKEQESY